MCAAQALASSCPVHLQHVHGRARGAHPDAEHIRSATRSPRRSTPRVEDACAHPHRRHWESGGARSAAGQSVITHDDSPAWLGCALRRQVR
eukprot:737868-Pyramimonas_sp.AAC.1